MPQSFLQNQWQFRTREFSENSTLLEIFTQARGLRKEDLPEFCQAKVSQLSDPEQFPQMKVAVKRILQAMKAQEKVLVFGDFDLDGISAAAILFAILKKLGTKVSAVLPSRRDGFGLSGKFVNFAMKNDFKLFITCDTGIANFAEIERLRSAGVDTIVTDHHSVPKRIPNALAILHPKFPVVHTTDFTGAGVALKLAQGLLQKVKVEGAGSLLMQLLEFAALGTVADLGSLQNENRTIAALGIASLRETKHPGILQLLENAQIAPREIDAEKISFFLAPRLNAPGRLAHPITSLELLLGKVNNAAILEKINRQRQELVEQSLEKVFGKVDVGSNAIVCFDENFHPGLIGLLAGKLAERFGKPAVAACRVGQKVVASCRGPADFHFARALKEMESLLQKSGGHRQAAGFSIAPGNFEKFSSSFEALVAEKRGASPPQKVLQIDGVIPPSSLTLKNVQSLQDLAPFGMGFPAPIFTLKNPAISLGRNVGKTGKHFACRVEGLRAIGFSLAGLDRFLQGAGNFALAFTPEVSSWQGKTSVQLKIVDALRTTS